MLPDVIVAEYQPVAQYGSMVHAPSVGYIEGIPVFDEPWAAGQVQEQYVPPAEPEPEPVVEPEPAPEPAPAPEPVPSDQTDIVLTGAAQRIADCESGLRRGDGTAVPGSYGTHLENLSGSSASGLFHFIDGTWQAVAAKIGASEYSRALHAPPAVQLAAFEYLYDSGRGAGHWAASYNCHGVG